MSKTFRKVVCSIFSTLGFDGLARELYYRIAYYRTREDLEISGIRKKIWATTYATQIRVKNLAGERELIAWLIRMLSPGDVVWDVGANMGIYSIFAAASINSNAKVYAFEPEKRMLSTLQKNIKLNQLNNITALGVALGDRDGEAILYRSVTPINNGIHSLLPRKDYRVKRARYTVRMRRADSLVKEGSVLPPVVMKMDIEGAELYALKGMKETLRIQTFRILLCEVHPKLLLMCGGTVKEIERLITEAGFHIAERRERGLESHLICVKV